MKRSELKFKVAVIALSLNNNEIGEAGQLIQEHQMQSPIEVLLSEKFISHTKESEQYFKDKEYEAATANAANTEGEGASSKEDLVEEIEDMLKDELIAWTEAQQGDNDLFDGIDLDANKAEILEAVLEVVNSEEFVA